MNGLKAVGPIGIVLSVSFFFFNAQAQESQGLWPLAVGNKWIYTYQEKTRDKILFTEERMYEIVGSEVKNGRTYFVFNNGQRITKEDGRIIEYNNRFENLADEELLLFDLNDLQEDFVRFDLSYSFFPPELGRENRFSRTVARQISFDGEEIRQISFWYGAPPANITSFILEPGIGITYSTYFEDTGEAREYILQEAVILDADKPTSTRAFSWGRVKAR